MIKKLLTNKGLTLIELIVTMAILGLVATVAYPMVASSQLLVSRQITNSHDRNDLRLAMSYLTNDIKYAKETIVEDNGNNDTNLIVTPHTGDTINYKIENGKLIREYYQEQDRKTEFLGIVSGNFSIDKSSPTLVNITLSTEDKETKFSVARLDYSVISKDEGSNFILAENVFIFGSDFKFGGSSILARNGTIYIGSDLVTSDLNQGNFTNVKNIFIDGNINLDGGSSGLGLDDNNGFMFVNGNLNLWNGTRNIYGDVYVAGNLRLKDAVIHGNIYVEGDVELGWTPNIKGNIYYKGNLSYPRNYNQSILAKCIKVEKLPKYDSIQFPQISLPKLRDDSWYISNGYLSGGPLFNGVRIFSQGNYVFNNWQTFKNVIIVSKGDITLSGWMHIEGVLFAPNGKITFSGGSFKGLAIARDGVFITSGGSLIEYKSIDNFIDDSSYYPFEF
ncbi:prepilin-type N-terminal cleavage/methylation domain-containing protein [Anaerobranca gottschalkii]|uniref:Prepilin-type N-terminal cleavage/methylation domain-containing protein n=1 Tax=Anaerobranca gottschalkii DSM 13577 TaxID=1120990 RepID=A0A1I0B325_9FIRM|nr:prepilin-type N-terminal cleavage/methylation domain-containing protein [Anaerobranca gottschalkii]SET00758.1 prepilin-type N-terminal cleavage/methylation domain-containing protein [Anaerobranca gottschalkii DSM 13577]